jgi:hypothetical protein
LGRPSPLLLCVGPSSRHQPPPYGQFTIVSFDRLFRFVVLRAIGRYLLRQLAMLIAVISFLTNDVMSVCLLFLVSFQTPWYLVLNEMRVRDEMTSWKGDCGAGVRYKQGSTAVLSYRMLLSCGSYIHRIGDYCDTFAASQDPEWTTICSEASLCCTIPRLPVFSFHFRSTPVPAVLL